MVKFEEQFLYSTDEKAVYKKLFHIFYVGYSA